jgi:hypothetical protein
MLQAYSLACCRQNESTDSLALWRGILGKSDGPKVVDVVLTLYTKARSIVSALAMSTGRMPCAFSSRTREASIEGGRPL